LSEVKVSVPLKIKLKLKFSTENGSFNRQSLIVHKAKSESVTHIILKLFAFIYFYKSHQELIIEPRFRFRGFKPDLVAFKNPEIPQEVKPDIDIWIECKKVKISKLKKLARYLPTATIYWFHHNHHLSPKTESILTSRNIELVETKMTRKDQSFLENTLLTQFPLWKVKSYEHSQVIIGTLDKEIMVEYQIINSPSSTG
jgi:hypothetical protein